MWAAPEHQEWGCRQSRTQYCSRTGAHRARPAPLFFSLGSLPRCRPATGTRRVPKPLGLRVCCSLQRDISSSPSLGLRGSEGSEGAAGRHPKTTPIPQTPPCQPGERLSGSQHSPTREGAAKPSSPRADPGSRPLTGPEPGGTETRPRQLLRREKGAGTVAWGQPWGGPRVEPPPRGEPR